VTGRVHLARSLCVEGSRVPCVGGRAAGEIATASVLSSMLRRALFESSGTSGEEIDEAANRPEISGQCFAVPLVERSDDCQMALLVISLICSFFTLHSPVR